MAIWSIWSAQICPSGRLATLPTAMDNKELLNAISAVLIVTDVDGVTTIWNPAAEEAFGWEADSVLGRSILELEWSADSESLVEGIRGALESGSEVQLQDAAFTHRDGSRGLLSAHVAPVRGPKAERRGAVLLGRHVTERRSCDARLMLSQKLQSIGELASGMAHEINTPTQFISDNARFLQDSFEKLETVFDAVRSLKAAVENEGDTREAQAAILDAAEDANLEYLCVEIPQALEESLSGVARVSKIVRAMTALSHPGSRKREQVDVNRAIRDMVTISTNRWKYVASLELELDEQLPLIPGQCDELSQAILNLIVNAADAISEGGARPADAKGTICIGSRLDGDDCVITVSDDGAGIPDEVRGRIFDSFFTTKGVGKGTGQGLAISRLVIAEKHEGSIDVESRVGEGTTFTIRLPLVRDTRGQDASGEAAA